MDPLSAALAFSTLASGVSSLFGGGKKKATTGVTGPQVITLPQYSFTEPRLQTTSDFISNNIDRMNRGEYPTYYQNALPTLRENMSRPLRETYYGRPGERTGAINAAMETGSITGIGPRTANAQATKQIRDYTDKESAIDEYLTKMGVDIMSQDAYRFPQLSMSMPKGPDATVLPGQSYSIPESPDYLGTAISTFASAAPYLFGGQGGAGQDPNMPIDIGGGRTAPPPNYNYGFNPWSNSAQSPYTTPTLPQFSSLAPSIMSAAGPSGSAPFLNIDWSAITEKMKRLLLGSGIDPSYLSGAFQQNNYTIPGY